ncbi:MAG: VanZ family protein [Elusimicrobia bacterium]|jgi:hypothetical protein|nr:VanZ family protein [Elusimicrobiota bacterium]
MEIKINISKYTIIWALFIIISASFMRQVLNFLIKNSGWTAITIMLGALFAAGGIAVFLRLYKSRPTWWRILLFIAVLAAGFFYARQMGIIEERLHLIKYGLLGWLISGNIVRPVNPVLRILIAVLFCVAIGGVDEVFQIFLPWRVGDIRDVLFAGIGGLWGTFLFLIANVENKTACMTTERQEKQPVL